MDNLNQGTMYWNGPKSRLKSIWKLVANLLMSKGEIPCRWCAKQVEIYSKTTAVLRQWQVVVQSIDREGYKCIWHVLVFYLHWTSLVHKIPVEYNKSSCRKWCHKWIFLHEPYMRSFHINFSICLLFFARNSHEQLILHVCTISNKIKNS